MNNEFISQFNKLMSLKAVAGIKELKEIVNNDLTCAYYRKKTAMSNDESEEKDMEVSKNKE